MITAAAGYESWTQHLSDYTYEQLLCMRIVVEQDIRQRKRAQEILSQFRELCSWLLDWGREQNHPGFDFTSGDLVTYMPGGEYNWTRIVANRDLHWIKSAIEHIQQSGIE